mmetsp:Transcript_29183/g.47120  ORF Transcript_29183/g.47120 Transcript_29183/m.47120 type:complete len:334 (+) Transcript_29183:376-1377(+)
MRALWRPYYANTNGVIWVVDAQDKDRISETAEELHHLFREDELRDCVFLILINKGDLPNAMNLREAEELLNLSDERKRHKIEVRTTCATSGEGLLEGLQWLADALSEKAHVSDLFKSDDDVPDLIKRAEPSQEASLTTLRPPHLSQAKFKQYLSVPTFSMPDEDFLKAFQEASSLPLDHFNHAAKIRMMWLYLSKVKDRSQGRRTAVDLILNGLSNYYKSKNLVYHMTLSYFWLQLVDLAINAPYYNPPLTTRLESVVDKSVPTVEAFETFVLSNLFLLNEDLVTDFYSINAIFHKPESLAEFVLPDKKPLPSILSFSRDNISSTSKSLGIPV